MKEEVIDQTPKRMYVCLRKKLLANSFSAELKFETFTPLEIKRNAVVELTDRDIYLITENPTENRIPTAHGPLDLRLVSVSVRAHADFGAGIVDKEGNLRNVRSKSAALHRAFWIYSIGATCLSHRIFQEYPANMPVYLQSTRPYPAFH